MIIPCRGCSKLRVMYAKGLCNRCYWKWRRRYQRNPDDVTNYLMLNPPYCRHPGCMAWAVDIPGCLPYCSDHHMDHYHGERGMFASTGCECVLMKS